MTKDETIRRAEIAMAWARGKVVQARTVNGSGNWIDIYSVDSPMRDPECPPDFFDLDIEWRIKPKPLECWVWVDEHNEVTDYISTSAEEPRTDMAYAGRHPGRWVRMREVDK